MKAHHWADQKAVYLVFRLADLKAGHLVYRKAQYWVAHLVALKAFRLAGKKALH